MSGLEETIRKSESEKPTSKHKLSRRTFTILNALGTIAALAGISIDYKYNNRNYLDSLFGDEPAPQPSGPGSDPVYPAPPSHEPTNQPTQRQTPPPSLEDLYGKYGQASPDQIEKIQLEAYVLAEGKEKGSAEYNKAVELWRYTANDFVETPTPEERIEKDVRMMKVYEEWAYAKSISTTNEAKLRKDAESLEIMRDKLKDGRLTKDEKDFQYKSLCFAGEKQVLTTRRGYMVGYSKSSVEVLATALGLSSLPEIISRFLGSLNPEAVSAQTFSSEELPTLGPATPNQIKDYTLRALEFYHKSFEQKDRETAYSCKKQSEAWMLMAVHAVAKSNFRIPEYLALAKTFAENGNGAFTKEDCKLLERKVAAVSQKLQRLAEEKGKDYARNALYSNLRLALNLNRGLFGDLLTT